MRIQIPYKNPSSEPTQQIKYVTIDYDDKDLSDGELLAEITHFLIKKQIKEG